MPASVLDPLARQLAEAHHQADHASLVRVRATRTGPEVALCPLPAGVHPADGLVGHTVPGRWSASGLVAPAGARPLDDTGQVATPVVAAILVSRTGHVAHHLSVRGPDSRPDDLPATSQAPTGRLLDLLRRSLGLATDPPGAPAAEWWRVHWLDAVVTMAASDPRASPGPDTPLTDVLAPDLVDALVSRPALAGPDGWAELRRLAAAPEAPVDAHDAAARRSVAPFVDPSMAAWMDDGCFARWLLGCLPPVDELLELAAALVPPTTFAALQHTVGVRSR